MSRSGIETERKRPFKSERDTNVVRGIVTTWETNELELKRLTDQYFEEHDKKLLISF